MNTFQTQFYSPNGEIRQLNIFDNGFTNDKGIYIDSIFKNSTYLTGKLYGKTLWYSNSNIWKKTQNAFYGTKITNLNTIPKSWGGERKT